MEHLSIPLDITAVIRLMMVLVFTPS